MAAGKHVTFEDSYPSSWVLMLKVSSTCSVCTKFVETSEDLARLIPYSRLVIVKDNLDFLDPSLDSVPSIVAVVDEDYKRMKESNYRASIWTYPEAVTSDNMPHLATMSIFTVATWFYMVKHMSARPGKPRGILMSGSKNKCMNKVTCPFVFPSLPPPPPPPPPPKHTHTHQKFF